MFQGRHRAKWTRARTRKKPDGKLQNPKREISDAEGQILAEKLRDAYTGHRAHRARLSAIPAIRASAQGRFREFLDAGDNERRLTRTHHWHWDLFRDRQKGYEIEREQAEGIQLLAKSSKASAKSDEELTNSRKKNDKRTEVANKQKHQRSFKAHSKSSNTRKSFKELQSSEAALEKCLEQQASFYPQAKQLDLHEATQPS